MLQIRSKGWRTVDGKTREDRRTDRQTDRQTDEEQVTLTSRHNDLPLCHATRVRLSGLFPSVRNNPDGSLVIPLIPSDCPTLISSLLRLSAHHLALAALASQPLKSGTLSLYVSVPVPVLTPSVFISRPTTASRPSTPLNPSPLAPQIWLCWPLCAFINYIYLLTNLLSL